MKTDDFTLLTRSAVEQLLRSGPEFREFVSNHIGPNGPVRGFPNGAIEIDEDRVGDEAAKAIESCIVPEWEIEGAYVFQSLGPFYPKRFYCVQYLSSYQKKLKTEDSFAVGNGPIRPPAPGEFNLKHLDITVGFRTRIGGMARRAFVDAISAWEGSVLDRGIFSDGPMTLASRGVDFSDTRAKFSIDATLSGQDTLNWLVLSIFDFGEYVHVVTGVYPGSSDEFIDAMVGPTRGGRRFVEFSKKSIKIAPKILVESPPTGFIPPDARPSRDYKSPKFALLVRAVDEWDSFIATIYFGRTLGEERERLKALLEAWLLLGSFGGFGGVGIHSAGEVGFDDETDSAIIKADMGDADPEVALPILVRTLEGIQSTGIPIDALVFGRPK